LLFSPKASILETIRNLLLFYPSILMDTLSTQNTVTTKVSHLLDQLHATCDALISALEVNAASVGSYGGSIMHHFDSEYADRVINNLRKLKLHLFRLSKELKS